MAPTYPDWDRCHMPNDVPPYAKDQTCCPPYKRKPDKKFEFPTELPMRTRLAAHSVGAEYKKKYARAVRLMKELPKDDPRNFRQQADVHFAHCNSAFYMGKTRKPFKVHGGWFFLPWHRWYLYFYERILATLLEDDSFALPFWNWDYEEGMIIPPMYMDKLSPGKDGKELSPLYDENRNPDHANALVDLAYGRFKDPPSPLSREDLVLRNYMIMFLQIVMLGSCTRTFHGEKVTETSRQCTCGAGTLENMPHNTLHNWTGTVPTGKDGCSCPCPSKACYGEDMGMFYSAARDPIFFAHHANADRMWTIWKSVLKREDYRDPDLLDTKFFFYDENKQLVEVTAGDAFDPKKLRYQYQHSPTPWLFRPEADAAAAIPRVPHCVLPTWDLQNNPSFRGPVKLTVPRTPPPSTGADAFKEVLVIEGIRVQRNIAVKLDVFVQLDDCLATTPYVDRVPPEFAGTFVELPRGAIDDVDAGCGQSSMRTVISEVLAYLGLGRNEDEIVVTLIPKVDLQRPIYISAVKIENECCSNG